MEVDEIGGFTQLAMSTMDSNSNPDNDKNLRVLFHNVPVQDVDQSRLQGRPIYKDRPHITIMTPGSRDNVIREVRPTDKYRFSKQWAAFEQGTEAPLEGTPLEAWPAISRSLVLELKHFNIHTVEQILELPDVHAQNFMGFSIIKKKAKAFIDAAEGLAPISQMAERLEEMEQANKEMQNTVVSLTARLKGIEEDDE